MDREVLEKKKREIVESILFKYIIYRVLEGRREGQPICTVR
jgi:hypothetical protein